MKTGATIEAPIVGSGTATPSTENTKVLVKTYNDASPSVLTDSAFSLLVAC